MTCNHCRIKMIEVKRSFHKKRKWVCPKCKRARMQSPGARRPRSTRSD